MFPNTIHLASNSSGDSAKDVALIDGPTNQRTVRRTTSGGVVYDLVIAHQSTNENPGFTTQRSVVRLQSTKIDSETGKEYTAYAQLVMSIPRDLVTQTDAAKLVGQVLGFIYSGGVEANEDDIPDITGTNALATMASLYNGEP